MDNNKPPLPKAPVSEALLKKAAADMFIYLNSELHRADASIEHLGVEFQTFINAFATSQFESVAKSGTFKDPLAARGGRAPVPFSHLPPFLLCATGSISRNEAAPHSDLDLVIIVENGSPQNNLWAVSDWFNRYLYTSVANGGIAWPFNKVDSLSSANSPQGDINNVEYAAKAALSEDKNNSDLRILYRHGQQVDTDRIWKQFRDALRDPAKILKLGNALGTVPMMSIGLGSFYEKSVEPHIEKAEWPEPTVDIKIFWRIFNRMTAPLAALNGERPIGEQPVYTNITLHRLRDPKYDFDKRLQIAYLAIWEIRYRLHLLYKEEKDVLTLAKHDEAAIVAVWTKRAWPNLMATLPLVHNRLQNLPYKGALTPFPRDAYWHAD